MADIESVVASVEAEARADLERLLPAARESVEKYGPVRAAVELTSGLLERPEWTRMMVASVLGVALVQLAKPTVQVTHQVAMAFIHAPGDDPDDIYAPLRAAFEAAGLTVVDGGEGR